MAEIGGPRQRELIDTILAIASDLDLPAMLHSIVEIATELIDARYGAIGVLDDTGTHLSEFITVGLDEGSQHAIGQLPEGHGILGSLIVDARPLRLNDLRHHPDSYGLPPAHPPMRSFLGVPVRLGDEVFGNLYLTEKRSGGGFTDADEQLAIGIAAGAGVAIQNARLQARIQELALTEDRERIARDLHDTVIQRIFAAGLVLQASARLMHHDPDEALRRVESSIDELDQTIQQIRTVIFELEATEARSTGLRSTVLDVVAQGSKLLRLEPRVLFEGPIDTGLAPHLGTEVLAALREALSNVIKHAGASRVDVELTAGPDSVVLRVRDDGVGPGDGGDRRGSGLGNLADRAARLGGTFELRALEPHGTELCWSAPVT
jgi:signal transduction histidine kinase